MNQSYSPLARAFPSLLLSAVLVWASASVAADPIFTADLQKAEVGKLPENTMVLSGDFAVREEGGSKFIELPGSPLETFGLLFGPSQPGEASATGRFFGTKQGRKFPAFGISLGGVSGYRLEMSGGKKTLELFKGEESRTSVPYAWDAGARTRLRLQIRKTAAGCTVQGKGWADGAPEPEKWAIVLEEKSPPPAGRAAIWGTPYAGTPIRYDELRIEAVK